jgi:hypothetical protein
MNIFSPVYRAVLVCWLFVFAGIIGIFLPSVAGIDGFNGGFAISFFSLLVALSAFVCTFLFAGRARMADNMLNGSSSLAHWEYTDSIWGAYTEEQFKADTKDKRNLFFLMAAFFGIAIIVILIIGGEAGPPVALFLLGIVALLGVVAFLSAQIEHAHNERTRGGAYISRDGVMLNGRLHLWKGWGASLESVVVKDGDPPLLIIDYSAPSGYVRAYYTVRVPIPPGQMANAEKIAEAIKTATRH